MIKSLISKSVKWWSVAIVMMYYLAVVLPHIVVGKYVNQIFDAFGRVAYNNFIIGVVSVVVVGSLLVLRKRVMVHPARRIVVSYLTFSMMSLGLCFYFLFVINIEVIHFLQYAILSILLFALTKSCRDTMTLAVFMGALDELYQYLVLDTSAPYYDFNDVLFDTLGAGIGLLLLKILGSMTAERKNIRWWRRLENKLVIAVGLSLLVMQMTGHFSVNLLAEDPAFFTLFKKAPQGFWSYPGGAHARLHILAPIPGLILIFGSAYVYGLLDRVKPLVETN